MILKGGLLAINRELREDAKDAVDVASDSKRLVCEIFEHDE